MMNETTRSIRPSGADSVEISLPPSKSYTNRALIAAALADGTSTLSNMSLSDDSKFLLDGLAAFGVLIRPDGNDLIIEGTSGQLGVPQHPVYVGNAGTAMRFLASLAGLAPGDTCLNGDEQMQGRPMRELLEALCKAGVRSTSKDGYAPITIHGGKFRGGVVTVRGEISSQYVSSLLLAGPYATHTLTVGVKGELASLPYVDMTLHVMRTFGASVEVLDPRVFQVSNVDKYIGQSFTIEADASSATYFLAAAAITGRHVRVLNLSAESLQGDARFINTLADMGCKVNRGENFIEAYGGELLGIEVDMNEMPDCVPTLAVVSAFAHGPTTIHNIAHLRHKETDRLTALAKELTRIGAGVELFDDGMTIRPRALHSATIETYNDHRIAMSFAVAGLLVPGIVISNPACVSKSFPKFWEEFQKLELQE